MNRRGLGIGLAALVAVAAAAWLLWPRSAPEPAAEPARAPVPPGAEFTEARIVGRRQGVRQWVVDTQRLREERDDQVRAERIESGTLYRDEKPFIDLQAAEAVANQKSNDLTVRGDVVAVHVDGAVLRTEVLQWLAAEERLVAPGPVVVERDDARAEAGRMEVYWSEEKVRLYDDVTMGRAEGHWLVAQRVDLPIDGDEMWVYGPFRAGIPARGGDEDGTDDGGDDGGEEQER